MHLPKGLTHLIALGVWPGINGPSMNEQQTKPLVQSSRVQLFAEDESLICLAPPPFSTIAEVRAKGGAGDFWETCGALHQVVPERALIIGDFGMGSDAPVILDFGKDEADPPVLHLRWPTSRPNEWVQGARNFDEFAVLLGLSTAHS